MDAPALVLCLTWQFSPLYFCLPNEPKFEAAYKHCQRLHCEAVAVADQFGHWTHGDAVRSTRFAAAVWWAAWWVTWRQANREQRWQWSGVILRMASAAD